MGNSAGFGFLIGTHDVVNRWRKDILDPTEGSACWEEFPGVARASAHFDGRADFDEIEFLTIGICRPGPAAGTGTFCGDDEHDGHKVKVRFIWSGITATTGVLRGRGADLDHQLAQAHYALHTLTQPNGLQDPWTCWVRPGGVDTPLADP
ncbi:hypothetical protein [Streptomyces atratus]|uniref:hypothetical protein n=1 Tax=Streptomyces atratus TaxID=1893 RepID=UPI0037886D12